ncbi:MAG: hypothetical protein ACRDQ5_02475 [Sciscionella sp.]
MNTIPSVLSDAYRHAHQELFEYVENAEDYGEDNNDWSDEQIDTARDLIGELAMILRRTFAPHKADNRGSCTTCATPWPCPIIRVVHELVTNPDTQIYQITLAERDRH